MKNYVAEGDTFTGVAPYAVLSGGGVLIAGSLFGIAVNDAANGATVTIKREGVFTLAKVSAQAWTLGALIYWDDATKLLTTTATSNKLVGIAWAAAANPTPTGTVLLTGAAPN